MSEFENILVYRMSSMITSTTGNTVLKKINTHSQNFLDLFFSVYDNAHQYIDYSGLDTPTSNTNQGNTMGQSDRSIFSIEVPSSTIQPAHTVKLFNQTKHHRQCEDPLYEQRYRCSGRKELNSGAHRYSGRVYQIPGLCLCFTTLWGFRRPVQQERSN